MPQYMLLLNGADLDKRSGNEAIAPQMFQQFSAWLTELREAGHLRGSHKLHDRTGVRLTVRGGQVIEGPFMETKEAVGGAVVLEAGSLEQATQLARNCPVLLLQNGSVEIRLVEEVRHPSGS